MTDTPSLQPTVPTVEEVFSDALTHNGYFQWGEYRGTPDKRLEFLEALEAAYDQFMPDWPSLVDWPPEPPKGFVLLVRNQWGWSKDIGDVNSWETEEEAKAVAAELDELWGKQEWSIVPEADLHRIELIG